MYSVCKILGLIFFTISLYGIVYSRRNLIINLIFIELGFLSLSILLLINFWYLNAIKSQILIIYILTLTAIETAVGLALFIIYYKQFQSIEVEDFYTLKY